MADKKEAKVRVRAGVLPEVREIRRPDFTKKAADIEKAEAERVLNQGDAASDEAQAAAVAQSLEAQEEAGADSEQLDESAISDVARWYVAHTYSGYENKVREGLIKTVENRHLENQIFEVTVPMQDVYELKNGAKKLTQKKLFPGYVLVRMIMNDETWYVVRNTTGVTGFVGSEKHPIPLTDAEAKRILDATGEKEYQPELKFELGDVVRIKSGVFENYTGKITAIEAEDQRVKVDVDGTPIELGYDEIEEL